ncbi:gp53-like domain-containing protein [Treponema sp. SP13]|uniref:gp53-like domain-containing protein n=1 Tax=Treponema sp. SP13 TaxID=2789742 RepID=UPI003D8DA410
MSVMILTNGLIVQWINVAGNWSESMRVSFPIKFSKIPSVMGSMSHTGADSYSGTVKIFNKNLEGFNISANHSGEITNSSLSFICIGK